MSLCPSCNKELDAATSVPGNDKPEPRIGDFSVCFYCGTLLVFDSVVDRLFTYHILTEEERKVIDKNTLARLDRVQAAVIKRG